LSAGRVVLIVLGSIVALLGLGLAAGGGFLLWVDRTQREGGYLTTQTERFATSSYALTRERLEVDAGGPNWIWNDNWLGKVRIRGEGASAKPLFIGVGPEAAVAGYLGRVAHADVEDIDVDPFRVDYRQIAGAAPRGPPTAQSFWAASASGQGRQSVTWKVRDGDWSVVLMNADGSRGVAADVDLGAQAVVLALGRDRFARRRRAHRRRECRADRPCRAETAAAGPAAAARHDNRRSVRSAATSKRYLPSSTTGAAEAAIFASGSRWTRAWGGRGFGAAVMASALRDQGRVHPSGSAIAVPYRSNAKEPTQASMDGLSGL
jgi:hypothetical protein